MQKIILIIIFNININEICHKIKVLSKNNIELIQINLNRYGLFKKWSFASLNPNIGCIYAYLTRKQKDEDFDGEEKCEQISEGVILH